MLVVYVDDFMLAGPEGNLIKGWNLLRFGDKKVKTNNITMHEPKGVGKRTSPGPARRAGLGRAGPTGAKTGATTGAKAGPTAEAPPPRRHTGEGSVSRRRRRVHARRGHRAERREGGADIEGLGDSGQRSKARSPVADPDRGIATARAGKEH